MSSGAFDALKEHIDNIWLVDTHEHIGLEEDYLKPEPNGIDFSRFFIHYASVDLVSAGLPTDQLTKIRSHKTPIEEKWAMFEPFWEKAKNTAYCKSVDLAIKEIFDLPGLTKNTYQPLAEKMREMLKPGYYRHILKDLSKIAISIVNIRRTDVDRELFVPVLSLDGYVMVSTRQGLTVLESASGMSIHSLDDLVNAMAKEFEMMRARGIVAFKSPIAYQRTLYFEYPSKTEAENSFNKIFTERGFYREDGLHGIPAGEAKPFQDYVYHKLVQLCAEHDIPMQIHTGVQEGNGNYLAQTNPVLLTDIFMKYPKARFDIFHAGYPYWGELGLIGKMFPGVYVDLCWTNIISPAGTRRALNEWLELMPASKIFAFGGDYCFVEGACSHAKFARYNVTKVLADKVDDGYFTLEDAKKVADRILRENAKEFFKLDLNN